ncbi:YceI family protein [Sedimentitalea todarodis]|uniref:YceI family protein n=1 Tax=Sedimentitalea todarodis TaxID=1631240 RepID=A0ABU3VCL7_9RHOB|nr:YceI family protein [Sedimentitalea todarodis]MDU9003911.1 YceI family protein [Sedimentitalea todarodis]
MRPILIAAALGLVATTAAAEPETYTLDPSHSQVLFSYNHLGYSTTWGMFSGFEGKISFDTETPEASSVEVSMPVTSMLTGWEDRFKHFMSPDFFDASDAEMVTFASTGIEVTGENTALITGDLTLNGVTKEIVLDAKLNQAGMHPMANTPWAGFDATTQLIRSDYNLGKFAPFVSDEVELKISVEAQKAADGNAG